MYNNNNAFRAELQGATESPTLNKKLTYGRVRKKRMNLHNIVNNYYIIHLENRFLAQ